MRIRPHLIFTVHDKGVWGCQRITWRCLMLLTVQLVNSEQEYNCFFERYQIKFSPNLFGCIDCAEQEQTVSQWRTTLEQEKVLVPPTPIASVCPALISILPTTDKPQGLSKWREKVKTRTDAQTSKGQNNIQEFESLTWASAFSLVLYFLTVVYPASLERSPSKQRTTCHLLTSEDRISC